jgi:hypothetical protein
LEEQGSTGLMDEAVTMFFEQVVSVGLASLAHSEPCGIESIEGAHYRAPFALGGLQPPAMKPSISAKSQRLEAPSLTPDGIRPRSANL